MGLFLFLVAALVSILVFIGELISVFVWLKIKRKLGILIGLVDFVRVLRARMADYHDGW
jgi:hypothetical protein